MIIVELRWPGQWIEGSMDPEDAHNVTSLLHLMEGRLFEGAIALDWFEQSQAAVMASHQIDHGVSAETWSRESEERRQIEDALRAELPADLDPQYRWEAERTLYDRARRIQQNEKWRSGQMPQQYKHAIPFIHARTFLTSIDSIAQAVDQMIAEGWRADALRDLAEGWQVKVPNVRKVRNTTAHESERALRRGPGGRKIDLQPIDNGMISAPGGALVLNSLNNNRYGCTMADGHYGEVEVSAASLAATTELVQGALDAFEWTGGEQWHPYN